MTDRNKGRPPAPLVQVIRRGPAVTPANTTGGPVQPVRPATVAPAPGPRPTASMRAPVPRSPASAAASTPVPSTPSSEPSGAAAPSRLAPGGPRGAPGPRAARFPSNRPPPTAQQVQSLAKKERVPNRIAKGELDGKMKCRIWKKLHAEEAKRFDQAWTLVEKTPGLDLADAFGVARQHGDQPAIHWRLDRHR